MSRKQYDLHQMIVNTVKKCRQMTLRGKKIFCMNRIRMNLLYEMWNEKKGELLQTLKGKIKKKKCLIKKKLIKRITEMGDDVRDIALKEYFKLCKEKSAKRFIDWRIK